MVLRVKDCPDKRKRQKAFSTLLQAGDYKEASRQLRDAAAPFRGDEPDSPKTYCIPPDSDRFTSSTWNEEEMRAQFCEMRQKIRPSSRSMYIMIESKLSSVSALVPVTEKLMF